jgi:hypothetical protein
MKIREGFWLGLQPYFNANSFIILGLRVPLLKLAAKLQNKYEKAEDVNMKYKAMNRRNHIFE